MKGHIKIGAYTGNGAAQNIELGFQPEFVQIVNVTDGDNIALWFDEMAAGSAIDISAAVAANAADGISSFAGTTGELSPGFSVGTDYSENAKVYWYIALANQ